MAVTEVYNEKILFQQIAEGNQYAFQQTIQKEGEVV
jgi:hypothetical protein